ncbi:MAG: triphosphoribosyl-dephospho-CoA synthase [Candidatus Bathyarchaeota archaeon]|nr:MAG: triphosphoribosyl-dephospho-CoA synthase [Candidatus Bathyarchaeota archaeon]
MLHKEQVIKHISNSFQLAILLEVSAPKPGNITRTANFRNTRYEHFLASAVAVEPGLAIAAKRGIMVYEKVIGLNELFLGEVMRDSVMNIMSWQHGGNTLLGSVLLLFPLAAAAGMTLSEKEKFSIQQLRKNLRSIVRSTTSVDAVAVYETIEIFKPSGLAGKAPILDVTDPESKNKILKDNVSLFEIFKISASYDAISREWVENYPITFELGLPYFNKQLSETGNLNIAITHTFLKVLSLVPDTLIARKANLKKAQEVSDEAKKILNLGGLTTSIGREELSKFDNDLRSQNNRYNPGTTADIIAAIIALTILDGYRP